MIYLTFFLVLSSLNLTFTSAASTPPADPCSGDPFMSCFSRDVFIAVGEISQNLTQYLTNQNLNRASSDFNMRTRNFSADMCRVALPTIRCLASKQFPLCEARAKTSETAAISIRFFQSFRYIYWGCTVWLGGESEAETTCRQPFGGVYASCVDVAPEIRLIRHAYEFFAYRYSYPGSEFNLTTLTTIPAASCAAFKSRTGCLASKLLGSCSNKIAELALLLARYQLHIGQTRESDCSFTAADTTAKLSQLYNSRTTLSDAFWWKATSPTVPNTLTRTTTLAITTSTTSPTEEFLRDETTERSTFKPVITKRASSAPIGRPAIRKKVLSTSTPSDDSSNSSYHLHVNTNVLFMLVLQCFVALSPVL